MLNIINVIQCLIYQALMENLRNKKNEKMADITAAFTNGWVRDDLWEIDF